MAPMLHPANPSFEEGRLFARYLDRAAEGFFHLWLGRRSVDIIATAFVQQHHDLSYQHVIFAKKDQVVVGMVSGYTTEQHSRSSDRPLLEAAGRCNLRMMIMSLLFLPFLRNIGIMSDGDFYIQAVAVDKAFCGDGIGSNLLDEVERRAIASGATQLALDVSAKNVHARRLYERRGMTVAWSWPKRIYIPGFQFMRMTKKL